MKSTKGNIQMAKKFNDDFKQTIVDLYRSGKSVSDLSREYGITKVTIYSWIDNKKEITIDNESMSKEEVLKLRKRIAELEEENEILKKATAIFAKKR